MRLLGSEHPHTQKCRLLVKHLLMHEAKGCGDDK